MDYIVYIDDKEGSNGRGDYPSDSDLQSIGLANFFIYWAYELRRIRVVISDRQTSVFKNLRYC